MRTPLVLASVCVWLFALSNAAVIERRQNEPSSTTLATTPATSLPTTSSESPLPAVATSFATTSTFPSLSTEEPLGTISSDNGQSTHTTLSSQTPTPSSITTRLPVSPTTSTPSLPTNTNDAATTPGYTDKDGLPLPPKVTVAVIIGGIIFTATGMVLATVGVRKQRIQIFLSTMLVTGISIALLIDYVMKPPISNLIQGAYLCAVVLVGALLGTGALFIKYFTEGLGCLLGGFCLSMWILTLEPGGTIQDTGGKAILISLLSFGIWALSFSRHTRDYALMGSTAFSGATAFILGIDCFSQAGLKEFWLYIWNLNPNLFPSTAYSYPITKGMRVETVVIPILCILGVVAQLRLWRVIRDRRKAENAAREAEERQRETVDELRGLYLQQEANDSRNEWEKNYDPQSETRHSRLLHPSTSNRKLSVKVAVQDVDRHAMRGFANDDNSAASNRLSGRGGSDARPRSNIDRITISENVSSITESQSRHSTELTPTVGTRESSILGSHSMKSMDTMTSLDGAEAVSVKNVLSDSARTPSPLPQDLEFDPEEFQRPVSNIPDQLPSKADQSRNSVIVDSVELQPLATVGRPGPSKDDSSIAVLPLAGESLAATSRPPLPRVASMPNFIGTPDAARALRTSSSLHPLSVRESVLARRSMSSKSLKVLPRNSIRSSSTPSFSQTLVESPIREDVVMDFPPPARPRNSVQPPLSELELRRQSALRTISSPLPVRPSPSASQSTLSIPKPVIRISSADGSSIHSFPTSNAPKRASSTTLVRVPSHNSRPYSSTPSAVEQEATLAELRASIRRESSSAARQQDKLNLRRSEMLRERERARKSLQQQMIVKEYRDSAIESTMRRSDMQALHQEHMRKMQAQANRHA